MEILYALEMERLLPLSRGLAEKAPTPKNAVYPLPTRMAARNGQRFAQKATRPVNARADPAMEAKNKARSSLYLITTATRQKPMDISKQLTEQLLTNSISPILTG